MSNKLIKITSFNTMLNGFLGTEFSSFSVYRSKGLLTHLLKRKHFVAAKYIDCLPEIISSPDYIGYHQGHIELVKRYSDNIFVCIKLDEVRNKHYVSTMYDIKEGKIRSYVRSGRLIKVEWLRLD